MRWIALVLLVVSLVVGGCSSPEPEKAKGAMNLMDRKKGREPQLNNADRGAPDGLIDPPAELVAQTGVDAYPGAKVLRGASAVKGGAEDDFLDVVYFTSDDGKKVLDFYRVRLLEPKVVSDESIQKTGVYCIDGKNADGDVMRVQAHTINGKTNIHVIRRKKK